MWKISLTAAILSSSGAIPPGETTCPRYLTCGQAKLHFEGFGLRFLDVVYQMQMYLKGFEIDENAI